MHLALIHSQLTQHSGAETQLFNYLQQCYARNIQVSLFVEEKDEFANVPDNVTVHTLPQSPLPDSITPGPRYKKLRKLLDNLNADLVFSMRPIAGPKVLLCNGTLPGLYQALEKKTGSLRYNIRKDQQQNAFREAEIILAVSGMMKRELQHYYQIYDHKIKVLYPPVNTARFNLSVQQNKSLFRQQFGLAEDKISFLFVSTQNKRKGWHLMEEVFAGLQHDPRFELIVAGPEKPATELPNVKYAGYVKRTEELMAAVDYTLLPSRYEPFGLAAIESVACGTPAIVSQQVGAKEILSAKEAIVLTDFKVETWLETIQHIDEYSFEISDQFAVQNRVTPAFHFDRLLSTCGFDPTQYPVVNT